MKSISQYAKTQLSHIVTYFSSKIPIIYEYQKVFSIKISKGLIILFFSQTDSYFFVKNNHQILHLKLRVTTLFLHKKRHT